MNETTNETQPASGSTQSASVGNLSALEDHGFTLLDLWQIVMAQRRLVISAALVCFIGATAAAFLVTPKYRSEALLEVVAGEDAGGGLSALRGQFGGLANLAGVNLGGGSSKESALAVLRSRAFIGDFLKEEKLLPVLFSDEWDEKRKGWIDSDADDVPTVWQGVERFREDVLSVSEDRQTGLVTLSITWTDRELSARWAGELIVRINRRLRDQAIEDAGQSIAFLNRELAKTQFAETKDAISNLLEQLINEVMMANVREEFAFKVLDPPVVAPADEFVEPRRLLWIILGIVLGGFLGILAALFRHVITRPPRS